MIAMLRGRLVLKDFSGVVVDVGGVGYRVNMPLSGLDALPALGSDVTLNVHTSVREDAIELFGFLRDAEKRLFVKLISVSGVGAKLALSALSSLRAEELVQALMRGDLAMLTSIKGVGKKTAERMVIELRDKVGELGIEAAATRMAEGMEQEASSSAMLDDLRSALINLGYTALQADKTVGKIRDEADGLDFNGLLQRALKVLRS